MSSIAMPEAINEPIQEATVYVDLDAIRHNTQIVRELAPQSQLLAMVKANAYGHGIIEVGRALDSAADYLGVARISEAEHLRNNGIDSSIVVMSELLNTKALEKLDAISAIPVIYCDRNCTEAINFCEARPMPYWLKFDTGMHRLGLSQLPTFSLESLKYCRALITHFHSADTDEASINQQLEQFAGLNPDTKTRSFSLGNSASIIRQSTQSDIVRPGIMLYGHNPTDRAMQRILKPAMQFYAPVVDIHHIDAGEGVGYNHRWRAERSSIIATVAAGYGDGYPRQARDGTPVCINGQRAPLAGTVSMDMITVDITELGGSVNVGDAVELWGQSIRVEEVAEYASTISYDLITGIQPRVLRRYSSK